jgi:hypothetical protein
VPKMHECLQVLLTTAPESLQILCAAQCAVLVS